MQYKTYLEIRTKIESDLDLEDEIFITPPELLGYTNEAIDECEAEILTIYEDYFIKKDTIDLVLGEDEYDLPADIYASKIRSVIYNNGSSDNYPVRRTKRKDKFQERITSNYYNTSERYRFMVINPDPTENPKLLLVPKSRITLTDGLEVWYIRNAATMEDDTSICDIPEFINFVYAYTKMRCYEKEGHPNLVKAESDLDKQRELMIGTLQNMVPDEETELEMDLTHYEEAT